MADRSHRRESRDRYDRERSYYRPQEEQFDDQSRAWRDEDRSFGQMGETYDRDRDDYGQFDVGAQSYSRSSSRDDNRSDLRAGRTSGYSTTSPYGGQRYDRGDAANFRSFTGSDFGGADFVGRRPTYGPSSTGSPYGGFGASYADSGYGSAGRREYGDWHDRNERGWFERAGDEVASWFGDEDAARRREQDHRGRGPSGYVRSDERVQEDVNDALTEDWRVDASQIQVSVVNGDVTLDGTVSARDQKRRAEDVIEDISGVKNVQNNLRVTQATSWDRNNTGDSSV